MQLITGSGILRAELKQLKILNRIKLKFDRSAENIFISQYDFDDDSDFEPGWKKSGNRSWILTDEGLNPAKKISQKQK